MSPSTVDMAIGQNTSIDGAFDGPIFNNKDVKAVHEEFAMSNGRQHSYRTLTCVNSEVVHPMSGPTKLRRMLLESNELIICPGVYDGLSARTAIEVGFNAMYMVRT